jgi:UDP-N-acetylmuramoylalanine--D-glutamate ligase
MTVMITKQFFKNKRITVFGLGVNGGGVSVVKFLSKCGVKEIIVTDIKKRSELALSLALLKNIKNITYVLGQHRPEDFTRVDMVIANPGIAWTNEYVKLALKKNIPVEMDASLFFQLCSRPIIGITGTKGKTTTAALITEILRAAGHHVVRVGSEQSPVLSALDDLKVKSVVVFELSSWRLSSLTSIKKSPHIAIFTNIFPDHLNYYKSMTEYASDKKNIFAFQTKKDWLIVNRDNDAVLDAVKDATAHAVGFSEHNVTTGDGIFIESDDIVSTIGEEKKKVMALADIKMRGKHNIGNILAAIGGAIAYGADVKTIRKVVMNFSGVSHRLEFVREKGGIKYYNDTAATVPQAAILALLSFTEPIVLIAGGNNKKLEFSEFGEAIVKHTKDVVFFKGEATEKIIKSMREHLPEKEKEKVFDIVESMEDAVRIASEKAQAGDIVLLSPGATSFGLFANEFDRGEQFCSAVKKL